MRKFSLREAAMMLGLDTNRKVHVCPVCGHKSAHFNWAEDIFNCPACGEYGGGVLDLWIFHRGLSNLPYADAKRKAAHEMNCEWEGYLPNEASKIRNAATRDAKKDKRDQMIADVSLRNHVYKKLLEYAALSPDDHKDLVRRGLTDSEIRSLGIKTLPHGEDSYRAAEYVLKAGLSLVGVPGFYKDHGRWKLADYASGYLIPQKNIQGEIQGMQIRRRFVKNGGKYIFLSSSGKETGTKAYAFVHVALSQYPAANGTVREAILTEGPLKADLINKFSGMPVLAVPGVSSLSLLPETLSSLKELGLQKIDIAYDMDLYKNPMVLASLGKLKRILSDMAISCQCLKWDEAYKGLDDYLLARAQKKS
jgi:DNA primase